MSALLRINLLPGDRRRLTRSPVEQFHRTPLMWLLAGLMVVSLVGLIGMTQWQGRQVARLRARVDALQPREARLDHLAKDTANLRAQEGALSGLESEQVQWARRLNIISDVLPDGMWFDEFMLDQAQGLVIRGAALAEGVGGASQGHVGRLVQQLKDDAAFRTGLGDIQIESIKRDQDGDIELVRFTITASPAKGAPGG